MGEVGYVYILKNEAMPGRYKIGKTKKDVLERIKELYNTSVPLPFECVFAAKVDDYDEVEKIIQNAFKPDRVNENREFFTLDPVRVIPLLKHMQIEDVTNSINKEISESITEEDRNATIHFKPRRPRFKFDQMGIKVGSKITLVNEENPVEVTIEADDKVLYNGSEYALTPLTQELLGIKYKILPLQYWKYNGKLLDDYYNEAYPVEE